MLSDFTCDFRFHDSRDNEDWPFCRILGLVEFSECNRSSLLESFLKVKDHAKGILEIGVCRNGKDSSTYVFLNNKKDETVYLGVDLEDKKFLDNTEKNIHTLKTNSSNTDQIMEFAKSVGIQKFDYIFIDGWHSINQCIEDWKFVSFLADGGVVGLHDTNHHPGPMALIKNIDKNKWHLTRCCPEKEDNGISFLERVKK
jgi:predicted O-methyltransferase YrrM